MKPKRETLPFAVITLAIHGDVEAMNHIVKHFGPYIIKLSQKTLFDKDGTPSIHIDPETQRRLETGLIIAILRFELD